MAAEQASGMQPVAPGRRSARGLLTQPPITTTAETP
jgi:hypothetical protein